MQNSAVYKSCYTIDVSVNCSASAVKSLYYITKMYSDCKSKKDEKWKNYFAKI